MSAFPHRESVTAKENGREPVRLPPLLFRKDFRHSGNFGHLSPQIWYVMPANGREPSKAYHRWKRGERMAKERFVEVYNQGIVNVARIIVDTETGVNYLLASHNKANGTGLTILVDRDGKPIVTPID